MDRDPTEVCGDRDAAAEKPRDGDGNGDCGSMSAGTAPKPEDSRCQSDRLRKLTGLARLYGESDKFKESVASDLAAALKGAGASRREAVAAVQRLFRGNVPESVAPAVLRRVDRILRYDKEKAASYRRRVKERDTLISCLGSLAI